MRSLLSSGVEIRPNARHRQAPPLAQPPERFRAAGVIGHLYSLPIPPRRVKACLRGKIPYMNTGRNCGTRGHAPMDAHQEERGVQVFIFAVVITNRRCVKW